MGGAATAGEIDGIGRAIGAAGGRTRVPPWRTRSKVAGARRPSSTATPASTTPPSSGAWPASGPGCAASASRRGTSWRCSCSTRTEHLECWLGIPRVGLVLNELNTRLAPAELAFILDDCDTRALVVDDTFLEVGRELVGDLPERCEHLDPRVDAPAPGTTSASRCSSTSQPGAAGATTRRGRRSPGSSTPAARRACPKGVMLTHGNLDRQRQGDPDRAPLHERRPLPARRADVPPRRRRVHVRGHLGGRRARVRARRSTRSRSRNAIEAERITASVLVPTMINLLVERTRDAPSATSRACARIFYGGSPMPAGVLRQAHGGPRLRRWSQLYGMTEAAPAATICRIEGPADEEPWATRAALGRDRRSSASRSRIRRRRRRRVADVDEVGEVWVRGPNIMAGYWRRPEETAAALTATAGTAPATPRDMDADGYVYIVDRVKDMIVTGGENVYCAEVESALSSHPAVLEVAVFGVPDDRWGEARARRGRAARAPAARPPSELVEHCRELIAGYKVPRSVELRAEPLPKSGAGKILSGAARPHWKDRGPPSSGGREGGADGAVRWPWWCRRRLIGAIQVASGGRGLPPCGWSVGSAREAERVADLGLELEHPEPAGPGGEPDVAGLGHVAGVGPGLVEAVEVCSSSPGRPAPSRPSGRGSGRG